jgi:hypothetical protein
MAIKASDTITVVRIADGTSVTITSTSVEYQKSSSGTAKPSTWQSTIPDVPAGQYLWTKTTVYYSNGKSTVSYSVAKQGSTGAAGKGIKSTTILYAKSSSNTSAPSSGWQGSVPATDSTNKYLWTKTTFTYTDNTTSTSYTVGSTLDGMSVGGRNLFKCSSMINERLVCDGIHRMNSVTSDSYETEGCHIVTPSTGNDNNGVGFYFEDYSILGIHAGDTITFSLDVKGTSDSNTPFLRIHMDSTGDECWWTGTAISKPYSFIPSSEFARISITWTIPKDAGTFSSKAIWFAVHGNYESDLYVRNLKLEKGNIATDWTPAPEDAVAVVKTQYYLSTSTTSATGGTWLDTVPDLKENTCIWTRTAIIHGSGVITYSTPILDSVTKTVVQTAADIKQTNTNLTLVASRTSTLESGMTDAKKRLTAAEASIKVNADAIELKVSKNGIVSAINQTSESVKIQASKISLEGLTTINNLFKVNTDGSIEATNAVISGKITASTGTIGGWRIGADSLTSTNSKGNMSYIGNGTGDSQDVLWVRTGAGTDADPYKWPIILRATGQAIFNNASITGGIHATSATIDEIIKMKDIGGSTVTVLSAGVSIDDPHSLWINPWGEIGTVRIRGDAVEIGGNFNVAGGSAQFDSDVTVTGMLSAPYIELSHEYPYIDFHYNYSTADFTSRIIESASGVLRVNNVEFSSDDRLTFVTHKGGFYMGDDVWIRAVNDKNIWTGGAIAASNNIESYYKDIVAGSQVTATNQNVGVRLGSNADNKYIYLYNDRYSGVLWMQHYVNGTVKWHSISAVVTKAQSDIRLKTDISYSSVGGLDSIRKMKVRSFSRVDENRFYPIGFIADELEQINDTLVSGGGYVDGHPYYKSINELYLCAYAIKGIQELDTESSIQKDRIRTLESQLDTMRVILDQAFERIAKLEKQL